MKTLGEIAHDAFIANVMEEGYCTSCADWVHLSERYKQAWEEAAMAAYEEEAHRRFVKVAEVLRYTAVKDIV